MLKLETSQIMSNNLNLIDNNVDIWFDIFYKNFIIKGGRIMIKKRNIALCIIFSFITGGIYLLYWFVCLTNDANETAGEICPTRGGTALLLTIVTCGIYGWYWSYKMGEKVEVIRTKGGMPTGDMSILFLILQFFGLGIVAYAIVQDAINKYA